MGKQTQVHDYVIFLGSSRLIHGLCGFGPRGQRVARIRILLLQIWNHLLLEMFKFHILDLLLWFFLLKYYLFYWYNWLIVKILFTFVLNLIWLCCIFYWNWNSFKTRPADRPVWPAGSTGCSQPALGLICVTLTQLY